MPDTSIKIRKLEGHKKQRTVHQTLELVLCNKCTCYTILHKSNTISRTCTLSQWIYFWQLLSKKRRKQHEECVIFASFTSFNNLHLRLSGLSSSTPLTPLCAKVCVFPIPFLSAHLWKVVSKKKAKKKCIVVPFKSIRIYYLNVLTIGASLMSCEGPFYW